MRKIISLMLIISFVLLASGCGTDPVFWAALGDGINSGIQEGTTGGGSGSSSSGSSGSSSGSGSSSYTGAYSITFMNNSSETVTVYLQGRTYVIRPGAAQTHSSSSSSMADFDYSPSHIDFDYQQSVGRMIFRD